MRPLACTFSNARDAIVYDVLTWPLAHWAVESHDGVASYVTRTSLHLITKTYTPPHQGIPQLYFDQLNVIAQHLQTSKQEHQTSNTSISDTIRQLHNDPHNTHISTAPSMEEPTSQSFTLSQLKKRDNWPEWKQSRYKMLDQYRSQGMFGSPMPLPANANALHMLWTYLLKMCGTKKSRMVCNGNRRQKGTITLGHTYANSLDAASERLFWAMVAQEGLIAIGADVSNAFTEAPPPKAPLYLYIDEAYREWWTEHLGLPPIPKECNVVRVHNAIQGHPEASRLWEKHIDSILRQIGLTPATHEPCIYAGNIDGQRVIFLRQVDDFAVATKHQDTAEKLLNLINSKMRIQLKSLGLITRFNCVVIHQT
jgi:hypothetical protein